MEIDYRKKSRRDRMMHSNSFEAQEVREIALKKAVGRLIFPCFEDGNNSERFSYKMKEMQRPGKIEDVKKKIRSGVEEML